ncbi:hypothetical protein KIW84_042702 [Lathyrus oleraceus]|uniref:Uncharacterized protein n=1 Tax=Pisum sativum TaxID=3888 RepID=A0A9D4XFX9_PEA|nr:hypothetical protein KIW84_042702 [Pisum sativum]
MSEKGMSKKIMVSSNNDIEDDTIMYLDLKPLKIIVLMDISIKESKNAATKRKTSIEEVEVLSNIADGNNKGSGKDSYGKKDSGQGVRNDETYEYDNIPISHIMKSLINSVFIPQNKVPKEKGNEVVGVEEENESDKEPDMKRFSRIISDEENKKKKIKESSSKRKTLKRKLVVSSDKESNAEACVLYIVPSSRKNIGGKRVPMNNPSAPLDNVSFHLEESVKKWRSVCQRRVALEKEMSKNTLNCQEIRDLLKKDGLMKILTNIGPFYENIV